MKNKKLSIPQFASEKEEREFWENHDMTEYMEEIEEPVVFSNLKPSTQVITLRLPIPLLQRIKVQAHQQGVPYQSHLKVKLNEIYKPGLM